MKAITPGSSFIVVLTIALMTVVGTAYGQIEEPDVEGLPHPKTPLTEGVHNSYGIDFMLTNFGFGLGGHYSRVLSHYAELTFQTGITGIRDVSEQNFQSFLTGQKIVPNKYKRALGFPFLLGLKHRLFARHIDDNFRLFVGASTGPALTFVYPYVEDLDDNGFRTYQVTPDGFLVPVERVNDFFSGWGNGETKWGWNGEIKIGADFGSSFTSKTTVEIGYFFYYFSQGLQIMEPFRPTSYNEFGQPTDIEPFFDAQKHFGTPVIRFKLGGMW